MENGWLIFVSPSPIFKEFFAVLWIRIRIRSGFTGVPESGYRFAIRIRIQKGKNYPQAAKYKKITEFNFLKCWMLSFEG
jgi:hypothetical protein